MNPEQGIVEIPTMFLRGGFDEGFKVKPQFKEGCEWVKDDTNTILVMKIDGVLVKLTWDPTSQSKQLYRKMGELWFKCDRGYPGDRYIWEAHDNSSKVYPLPAGLYVAFGPDINNNPQDVTENQMIRFAPADAPIIVSWRAVDIKRGSEVSVEEFYNSIKSELLDSTIQGFLFEMEKPALNPIKYAQITRKDFGFPWPIPPEEQEIVKTNAADPFICTEI